MGYIGEVPKIKPELIPPHIAEEIGDFMLEGFLRWKAERANTDDKPRRQKKSAPSGGNTES